MSTPTIEEVMTQPYPDPGLLRRLKVGAHRLVSDYEEKGDKSEFTKGAKDLKAKLDTIMKDPKKSVFKEVAEETVSNMEGYLKEPADYSFANHELALQIVNQVNTTWDTALDSVNIFMKEDAVRAKDWKELQKLLSNPIEIIENDRPLIEADTDEDRKKGWNQQWTWRNRAQFNWGLETLREGLVRKITYHDNLESRADRIEAHLKVVASSAESCRKATNKCWEITDNAAPRGYQKKISPVMEDEAVLIKDLLADKQLLTHELSLLVASQAQQESHFKEHEVSGGAAMVQLQLELDSLQDKLKQLPALERAEASVPETRLQQLAAEREAEIARALQESQNFLAENTKQQELCKSEITKLEQTFRTRKDEVCKLIAENKIKQQETLMDHEQKQTDRLRNEEERSSEMKNLIQTAEDTLLQLRDKISRHELRVKYVKNVTTPFYHSFVLSLVNSQRDYLMDLNDKDEDKTNQIGDCLLPLFITHGTLCSSLIYTITDIEELLESCESQIRFCDETNDPKGELVKTIFRELKDHMKTCKEQAVATRVLLNEDITKWRAINKDPEELWSELAKALSDERCSEVFGLDTLVSHASAVSPKRKLRPKIPFCSTQRALPKGFHTPCKLPLVARTEQQLPPIK